MDLSVEGFQLPLTDYRSQESALKVMWSSLNMHMLLKQSARVQQKKTLTVSEMLTVTLGYDGRCPDLVEKMSEMTASMMN